MCEYCDGNSTYTYCNIYVDCLTRDYYLSIRTSEWDNVDDDYVYEKVYIDYCPWCGRRLDGKTN